MAAGEIRFYLDENIPLSVAIQLRRRKIEVVTLQEIDALGDSDINHLQRAAEMGCVLCTYDDDYLRIASEGVEHAGIVFGKQTKHRIGDWVKGLIFLHAAYALDDMKNRVEYL